MKQSLALVAAFLATGLAAPAVAQRTPDIRLDGGTPGATYSQPPQIAAAAPFVYATWTDNASLGPGGRKLFVNRSRDAGASWLAAPIELATGQAWDPQVAAAGTSVWLAWQDDRIPGPGSEIFVNYSRNGGATWLETDVRVSTGVAGSATSSQPGIAASGSSVIAAWTDLRNTLLGDIYANCSTDGGATWLADDVRLDTGTAQPAQSRYPRVAAAGPAFYGVWQDRRNGAADVYLNYSTDGGATWRDDAVRLDRDPPGAGSSEYPQIAVVGSRVFVVWQDSRAGRYDIYLNSSTDGGTTWRDLDVRLDTDLPGAAHSQFPQVAVSGSSVYVAWVDGRNSPFAGDIYLNYSADGGTTWSSSDVRINTNAPGTTTFAAPRIAASGSSVFATWEDDRTLLRDIYFNRSTDGGATWLAQDVGLDAGDATLPQIAASGSFVGVTWQDHRRRLADIYFNVPFGGLAYGESTAGTGGAPTLSLTGAPTLGSAVSLDVERGLGAAPGALWIGVGPASKTSVAAFGGRLLVAPMVAVPIALGGAPGVAAAGGLALPLSIPTSASLVGSNLNFQALLLDPGAPLGLSMTNGLELWIG